MNKVEYDSGLTNFGTWWLDNQEKCFRYWTYKRMFTPYEQENKFVDDDCFESNICDTGYIREAVELPDGDILLGFENEDCTGMISYRKLSEIQLMYCENGDENTPDWEEDCE